MLKSFEFMYFFLFQITIIKKYLKLKILPKNYNIWIVNVLSNKLFIYLIHNMYFP